MDNLTCIKEEKIEKIFKKKPRFTLQWHLTTNCNNRCKHCYVKRNPTILSLKECKKIIDDFRSVIKLWKSRGEICFTGGDPLLFPSLVLQCLQFVIFS